MVCHAAVMMSITLLVGGNVAATGTEAARPRAILEGQAIPLGDVSRYHCHDRDDLVIRCFRDEAARDDDIGRGPAGRGLLADPYVTFYKDEDYGGTSFTAYASIASLATYGWNDLISSFKSLSNGRPHWYRDINYGIPDWRWSAGAWVRNVGSGANDAISSVKNDP